MRKVITYSNKNYFNYGKLFLRTRHKIDAHFMCYGADLTERQKNELEAYNVEYKEAPEDFESKMQYLKFKLLRDEIEGPTTFIDFDTFFLRDWHHIFKLPFDLGITIRNNQKTLRAYANGGVIFCTNKDICDYAMTVMQRGRAKSLPEYDVIWNTLERGRPKHKTHYRTNLRWWVDQVFLSALIMRSGKRSVKNSYMFDFDKYRIGLFNCNLYNKLDPGLSDLKEKAYILHMKTKGREKLKKFEQAIR